MHDVTQSEADLAMKCYSAFMLGLKVVGVALDRGFSTAEYMKMWHVVQAVAAGEQTLNVSPAELQVGEGGILPAMKQHIQDTTQRVMRAEREMAAMLLRAADGFVVRDDAAG